MIRSIGGLLIAIFWWSHGVYLFCSRMYFGRSAFHPLTHVEPVVYGEAGRPIVRTVNSM